MMKKRVLNMLMILAMGFALAACGADADDTDKNGGSNAGSATESPAPGNDGTNAGDDSNVGSNDSGAGEETAGGEAAGMLDAILAKVEQPALLPVEGDMVKDLYHLDAALFEDYAIRTPMMNVKTNEISIIKVKDAKDIPAVEEGLKQRAADVQKQFETYLQDQYENAKNFKIVTKGQYVLFVISEEADAIIAEFEAQVK
ncbi:DUF4358 domain-containing protein [Paenibacillus sp. LHD-117]|uniref:DUF4358 domain-containing protein n=1 Tax=Paenibacillus sp. LHD-117 TaxID=3071412 RepID=UPI0027E067BF|nr:DUF4358 domain-containing protein [Paenibacillus sp. LHD-117]MDQ6421248.1 DUF4358 domain-containing protein [Paenibacillus sp. LHD-117]